MRKYEEEAGETWRKDGSLGKMCNSRVEANGKKKKNLIWLILQVQVSLKVEVRRASVEKKKKNLFYSPSTIGESGNETICFCSSLY